MPEATGAQRLARSRRFLLSVTDGHLERARAELSATATYRVPGRSVLAGTFRGPDQICRRFQQLFDLVDHTVDAEKWIDWMVGVNLVSVLARIHLQIGGTQLLARYYFVLAFDEHDLIEEVELFFGDYEQVERFLGSAGR